MPQRNRRDAKDATLAEQGAPETPAASAILNSAEELFCAKGFAAVSMREIAAHSGQHLASANYYFGSKTGLFEAVFLRRVVPVNNRRLGLLRQYVANGRETLPDIVDAYLRPLFEEDEAETEPGRAARLIMLFSKQMLSNPDEHNYLQAYYDEVAHEFIESIRKAMPSASLTEAVWGYNYMVGILVFTVAGRSVTARVSDEALSQMKHNEPIEQTISRLTLFICSGLVALGADSAE